MHRSMAARQNGHPPRSFAAHAPQRTWPHGMQAWSATSEKHMLHWHGPAAQPRFDRTGVLSPSPCLCSGLFPPTYSTNSHSAGPGSTNPIAHEQYSGSRRSTSRKNWPLYFPTLITPPCWLRRYSLNGPNVGPPSLRTHAQYGRSSFATSTNRCPLCFPQCSILT